MPKMKRTFFRISGKSTFKLFCPRLKRIYEYHDCESNADKGRQQICIATVAGFKFCPSFQIYQFKVFQKMFIKNVCGKSKNISCVKVPNLSHMYLVL